MPDYASGVYARPPVLGWIIHAASPNRSQLGVDLYRPSMYFPCAGFREEGAQASMNIERPDIARIRDFWRWFRTVLELFPHTLLGVAPISWQFN